MPDPDLLLWLDLETTDLDHTIGQILEIGYLVTGWDLGEHTRGSLLIDPGPIDDLRPYLDPTVDGMHVESGLWEALARGPLWTLDGADRAIADELDRLDPGSPYVLAGSGVSHFDRRWIDAHLPLTAAHLTHYTIDVGIVRRFLRHVAGIDTPDAALYAGTPHRALDDAARALEEARDYRRLARSTQEAPR